jgi:hypothetical protein
MEFGAGKKDAFGRQMLSPHEAAFAISYALGDRGPDEQLLKAAEEGRLLTKADYRREVERLLADKNYYYGEVDPSIDGGHYQSNETTHPKMIRFFRDFFGYRGASNIFKDPPRALGKFQNPSRGTLGTGGWLIREADMIVTWHVEKDQDVFENLLRLSNTEAGSSLSASLSKLLSKDISQEAVYGGIFIGLFIGVALVVTAIYIRRKRRMMELQRSRKYTPYGDTVDEFGGVETSRPPDIDTPDIMSSRGQPCLQCAHLIAA